MTYLQKVRDNRRIGNGDVVKINGEVFETATEKEIEKVKNAR